MNNDWLGSNLKYCQYPDQDTAQIYDTIIVYLVVVVTMVKDKKKLLSGPWHFVVTPFAISSILDLWICLPVMLANVTGSWKKKYQYRF